MKIAFCLYGLSGGYSERIEKRKSYSHNLEVMEKSYESYKKNIFDINKNCEFDIYLHTRKHNNIDKIINMYKPKKYIVDDKIILKKKYKCWNVAVLSRHDSVNKVLKLIDVNIDYNFILLVRFDLTFLKPLDFTKFKVKENHIYFPDQSHAYVNNKKIDTLSLLTKNPPNNIEWRKKDKNNYLNEWWMIFTKTSIKILSDMGKKHKNNLHINIHQYIPNYLSKTLNIELLYLHCCDTPLTRYYIYNKP